MILDGKTAIVTGGSTVVGMAIMLELVRLGANVVSDHVPRSAADSDLERRVHAVGSRILGLKADVSRHDDLKRLMAKAVAAFGSIDILVNNAGIESRTSLLTTTVTRFDHIMAVNIRSAVFATQLAAQRMIAQGGDGRIINISSVHEDAPMAGNLAFCISKGAMRMLTRTAALELAPHRILVIGVAPGAGSALSRGAPVLDQGLSRTMRWSLPRHHVDSPDEIAEVVGRVIGPEGLALTGTTVAVDGGPRQGDLSI